MKVQTDRYNWNVPVPLDSDYALGLFVAACTLFLAAGYFSGVRREALSTNPISLFSAVVAAAARRGGSSFWIVWSLIGVAAVFTFTSIIIFIGLALFSD
jgi:hypothetical protein